MGLLDSLLSGGSGGGLLDFLRSNALNQQFSSGLPSDQAQYGQAPSNALAQMQPNPAMMQPSIPQQPPPVIQAQQAPMQQPAQPQGPGFGDHLMAGIQGFANSGGLLPAIANGISGLATGQRSDPTGVAQQAMNVTGRALLAKGVDPQTVQAAVSNPELMKTLITQTYGPQTVQSLGNGYIYNPKTGKTERAYEPEDKIPAGFAKDDKGNMKFIPGGPADPAYIQLSEAKKKDPNGVYTLGRGGELYKIDKDGQPVIVHKNESNPEPMDPNALEVLARREIGGDFGGRKNLGRGAQGAADLKAITNKSSDILINEMGMTPAEAAAHLSKKQQEYNAQGQGLNSEARTTGVREANLNLILKAADAAIPAALEASDKVSRTGWVPLNKIIQGGEVMTSNPELKKFGMANLQLAEHWARAMNPTGVMRESDRDKALTFLSTADSKETYKEAVGQLRTQIERERDAVHSTRGMATMPGAAPETTPQPGIAPKAGNYMWMPGKGLVPKS